MKIKLNLLSIVIFSSSLFGAIQHSVIPVMDEPLHELSGKVNDAQKQLIQGLLTCSEKPLRLMSFNMLFNLPETEKQLDLENQWPSRGPRLIEYLNTALPDLIGSQELQKDQLEQILQTLGAEYAFFGVELSKTGIWNREIPAIFYKKDRLTLIEGKTYFFPKTNGFTFCRFLDRITGKEFIALNVHLAFGDIERRYCEASYLRDFLNHLRPGIPTVLMGDFNTFPFRRELAFPFYDGDDIVAILEDSPVKDSMKLATFGHLGPLATTNFCPEKKKAFCSDGEPGVILDHIFVNRYVRVLQHAIDPAQVDGHYPSDHFPVIVDVLLIDPC